MICLSSAGALAYFRFYLFWKTLCSTLPHSESQWVPFGLLHWKECDSFLFNQSRLLCNDIWMINKSTLKQTWQEWLTLVANCVRRSDDSRMLHFALRIAVCCVLPRYGNLDIHRWKFSFFLCFHILGICCLLTEVSAARGRLIRIDNDPSAGSPTETLLRLILPLSVMTYTTSTTISSGIRRIRRNTRIGRSDGRCVQRAGT